MEQRDGDSAGPEEKRFRWCPTATALPSANHSAPNLDACTVLGEAPPAQLLPRHAGASPGSPLACGEPAAAESSGEVPLPRFHHCYRRRRSRKGCPGPVIVNTPAQGPEQCTAAIWCLLLLIRFFFFLLANL